MKKLYSDAMSKLYETIIKLFVFLLVKIVSKKKNVSRAGNRVYHIGTNQNAKIEGFEMKIIKHTKIERS